MFADIDHNHPEVRQDIFYWGQWLASQVNLSGLRLDAIKHFSGNFVRDFIMHLDRTVGRNWFIVGEYWREDTPVLARYIEYMHNRISLFDVKLVSNFSRLSMTKKADLRTIFQGSLALAKPANAVVRSRLLKSPRVFLKLTPRYNRPLSKITIRRTASPLRHLSCLTSCLWHML